jgi:hypothetical protein
MGLRASSPRMDRITVIKPHKRLHRPSAIGAIGVGMSVNGQPPVKRVCVSARSAMQSIQSAQSLAG